MKLNPDRSLRLPLLVAMTGLFGSACSSGGSSAGSSSASQDTYDAWPPPALPDVVYTMSGHIEAGQETMYCQYVMMPTDRATAVWRAESTYTPGSHHFMAQRTDLTSLPDGGTTPFVCFPAPILANITGSYYEAQTPMASRELPAGVAHIFKPGEIMLLSAHYVNASGSALDANIEFKMHTIDPKFVQHEAGTFFLLDTNINVPPLSQAVVTDECPIPKDIHLELMWSHMHSRGVAFRAWTDDSLAAQTAGGDLYGTTQWTDPPVRTFSTTPPVIVHAGSNIDFSCTYQNTTSNTYSFGLSAVTAEMCLLHGWYWPRLDPVSEQCQTGKATEDTPTALPGSGSGDGGQAGD